MATSKPRITVTLSGRLHEVLKAISENSGHSMSAFVCEVLEMSLPTLERMAETFRKIKLAQDDQRKRIAAELDQAQSEVEPVLEQVLGQFDLFMAKIERAAGAAPDGSAATPAAAPAAASTPVTNRGVTPPPAKAPKPASPKAFRVSSSPRSSSKKSGV